MARYPQYGRKRFLGAQCSTRLLSSSSRLRSAWAPLVTEKLLSAHNKKLTGVYVMPDASFNFAEIDLKP